MPNPFEGKTYWVVGASEGLGRAICLKLADLGANLIITARGQAQLEALANDVGGHALVCDVTDQKTVSNLAQVNDLDGLIYCAGTYEPMSAADMDADAIHRMTAVNYSGAINVLAATLPGMIERRAGHVVLIGSLSGFRGLPGAIGYGASKAALMHLAENLRLDLRPFGIQVQRINPGFIRTRLTDKNDFDMPQIMSPERAADHVIKAMVSGRFSTSFPRPFAWLFTGGQHVPVPWFQKLFSNRAHEK